MTDEPLTRVLDAGAEADHSALLARAVSAYEAGDFAAVRGLCEPLRNAPDRDLAERAAKLAAKVATEPTSFFAIACCLVLVVGIVVGYAP
jgi:hypothetical protein